MATLQKRFIGPNEKQAKANETAVAVWPSKKSLTIRPDGSLEDPSLIARKDVMEMRRLLLAAEGKVSSDTYAKLPGMLITEFRRDGGANDYDTNNPKSVKLFKELRNSGYSDREAIFVTALTDAERRAAASGRDVFDVWNGTGETRDKTTGKLTASSLNNMRKVYENQDTVRHPMNSEFLRLLTEPPTSKDVAITRTEQEIADTFLGNKGIPITKPRYTDSALIYNKDSYGPIEDALSKRLTYDERKKLVDNSNTTNLVGAVLQLLGDTEQVSYGVKSPSLQRSALTSQEFQDMANKIRYLDSPEMKEAPPKKKSLTDIFKSWIEE